MELGATVCTAARPRCDACPIATLCAWRAAGYPAYDGPRKARQDRFEGADREVRGLVMRELRGRAPAGGPRGARDGRDGCRAARARRRGLVADGLAVEEAGGLRLPDA